MRESKCRYCSVLRAVGTWLLKAKFLGYRTQMLAYVMTILVMIATLHSYLTGKIEDLPPYQTCQTFDVECIEKLINNL